MRVSRRRFASAALAIGLAVVASQTALAASGDRDTSFGGDGVGEVDASTGLEGANAIVVANNKIVVAGNAQGATNGDILVARFDMNGNPDSTFGGGDGFVTLDLGGNERVNNGLSVLNDGSIVVSGYSDSGAGHYKLFLAKFTSTGGVDSTFGGGDGFYLSNLGKYGANGYDQRVLSNGKIVVAGSIQTSSSECQLALWGFTAKGKLDSTFGGGDGRTYLDMGPGCDEAWRLSALSTGKFLVGGWVQTAPNAYDVAIARFTSTGAVDTGFGHHGSVSVNPTNAVNEYVQSMVVTNNKILILLNNTGTIGLVRLNMNGSLDATFGGGDGVLFRTPTNVGTMLDLKVDSKGRVVIVGGGSGSQIYVARLKSTFAIDTGFGLGGYQTAAVGGNAQAVALQSDDKIVIAGYDSNSKTAAARFLP